MLAAAVVTAGVTSFAVRMVMVVTVNIGIVVQTSAEQCAHRRISVPADTAVELDARFGECCLRTAADAPAPSWQGIGILALLAIVRLVWQKAKGKAPSPIGMILLSAVLGTVLYQ